MSGDAATYAKVSCLFAWVDCQTQAKSVAQLLPTWPRLVASGVAPYVARSFSIISGNSLQDLNEFWGQGNNDAFEFELSFDPGELELDSKWKICWDNP